MNTLKKLRALHRVAEATLAARQARIASLQRRADALRAQIDQLDSDLAARSVSLGGQTDLAQQWGADLLWQQWIDQRKSSINQERARLAALLDDERSAMAEEFGRALVAEKLRDQTAANLRSRQFDHG